MNVTACEQLEDARKLPRGSRGHDSVKGLVFAQIEAFLAVREQRLRPALQMQTSRLHLRQVRKDTRVRLPSARDQLAQPIFQLRVRQVLQLPKAPLVHESCLTREFSSPAWARQREIARPIEIEIISRLKARQQGAQRASAGVVS